jgi:hypothetical protein
MKEWIPISEAVKELGEDPSTIFLPKLGKQLNQAKPGTTKLLYVLVGKKQTTLSHIHRKDLPLLKQILHGEKVQKVDEHRPNIIPIYLATKNLGYELTDGQLKIIGRMLNKRGYETFRKYDTKSKIARASIDVDLVPSKVLLECIKELPWLNVPPSIGFTPTPKRAPTPKREEEIPEEVKILPVSEVRKVEEEKPKSLYPIVETFLSQLENYLRPDLAPILKEIKEIKEEIQEIKEKSPITTFQPQIPTDISHEQLNKTISAMREEIELEKDREISILQEKLELEKEKEIYVPAPPQEANPKTMASYIEALSAFGEPTKLSQFMTAAESLKTFQPTESSEEFPSHMVWYGREWFSIERSIWFQKDFAELDIGQKRAVLHMLLLMSNNPYHKSLNTHKPASLHYYPSGTPVQACLYSRASSNIRVFWDYNNDEKKINFHRIIVKAG